MIDFAQIEGIRIPEGDVSALSIDGVQAWKEFFEEIDSWDLEWTYDGNMPDQGIWRCPGDSGEAGNSAETGSIYLESVFGDQAAEIAPVVPHGTEHCAFETEIMISVLYENSVAYAQICDGGNGSYQERFLRCKFGDANPSGMSLYVGVGGEDLWAGNPVAEIEKGTWNKLRMIIDKKKGRHRVYLNDRLVAVRGNDDLYAYSTSWEPGSPEVSVGRMTLNVRAMRYKNLG